LITVVLRDAKGKRLKSATQAKAEARLISKLQKESLKVHGDPPGHSEEGAGKRKKGK
jgi:acid phosphatase family membrane protein YuiD